MQSNIWDFLCVSKILNITWLCISLDFEQLQRYTMILEKTAKHIWWNADDRRNHPVEMFMWISFVDFTGREGEIWEEKRENPCLLFLSSGSSFGFCLGLHWERWFPSLQVLAEWMCALCVSDNHLGGRQWLQLHGWVLWSSPVCMMYAAEAVNTHVQKERSMSQCSWNRPLQL